MTCTILTAESAKGCGCAFEEWSREKKDMIACGAPVIASVGRNLICLEHLPDALMRVGSCCLLDQPPAGGGHPKVFAFKEDFLDACKKAAIGRSTPQEKELEYGRC